MPGANRKVIARRGRTKSDAKRTAILRGAKAVFLACGFRRRQHGRSRSSRAGVSKMTVYRHFGNKEDLFAGVITDLGNLIVEEDLERIFAKRPDEALRRYARKMIDIVSTRNHRVAPDRSCRMPSLPEARPVLLRLRSSGVHRRARALFEKKSGQSRLPRRGPSADCGGVPGIVARLWTFACPAEDQQSAHATKRDRDTHRGRGTPRAASVWLTVDSQRSSLRQEEVPQIELQIASRSRVAL